MNMTTLKGILSRKKGAVAEYPFGPEVLVYKVGGKIFALVREDADPIHINLKCPPDEAEALRAQYDAVQPGYHMNKRHWNTVTLDGTIDDATVRGMIDLSYDLIVQSLPRVERERLGLAPKARRK